MQATPPAVRANHPGRLAPAVACKARSCKGCLFLEELLAEGLAAAQAEQAGGGDQQA